MIKIQSYKSWCKTKICTIDQLQTILTELIFTETDTAVEFRLEPLVKTLIFQIAFTYMWLFSYSLIVPILSMTLTIFSFHDNHSNT